MSNKTKVDVPWGKTVEQHRRYYSRWRELNRSDYNKNRKAWADRYRTRRTKQARDSHLKTTFGMTGDQFRTLLKKQHGRCAICRLKPKPKVDRMGRKLPNLCIDHDHKTGLIRGLLCHNCNAGIGHLRDNLKLLYAAIAYLEDAELSTPGF